MDLLYNLTLIALTSSSQLHARIGAVKTNRLIIINEQVLLLRMIFSKNRPNSSVSGNLFIPLDYKRERERKEKHMREWNCFYRLDINLFSWTAERVIVPPSQCTPAHISSERVDCTNPFIFGNPHEPLFALSLRLPAC